MKANPEGSREGMEGFVSDWWDRMNMRLRPKSPMLAKIARIIECRVCDGGGDDSSALEINPQRRLKP